LGVQVPPGLPERRLTVQKVIKFLKETRAELTKVTWPTRSEIIGSTIVTVVVSIVVSIFIGIVDFILDKGVRAVF
jgi:preprotein translocase subunit SecE